MLQDILDRLLDHIAVRTRVVSCPMMPIMIPGITTGVAYEAGDAMGSVFEVEVPVSGIIYSATFWDLDDEGLQTDFEIFRHPIAATTDNAQWAVTDSDILYFITEFAFFSFDDHATSQTSELKNIGKAYSVAGGKFYIQTVARGVQDIAAGQQPRFQLQILSDDPNWVER